MRRWLASMVVAVGSLPIFGGSISAAPPAIEDILLTIKVRQALYRDEELRPHNIGVQVIDRVAILFGPVNSLDLGLRAESRLRGIIELRDVRNELDILETLPELLPERVPAPAPVPGLEPRPARPAPGVVPAELRSPRPEVTLLLPEIEIRQAAYRPRR